MGDIAPAPQVTKAPVPTLAPAASQPIPTPTTRPAVQNTSAAPPARPSAPLAAPAPISTPTPPAGVARVPAADAGVAQTNLVLAGQQWLDAYQRRDRDGMAAAGSEAVKVADERSVVERFPSSQSGVRRDLDQVELELTGDTAVLTARVTERADSADTAASPLVSRVSQIWVRRAGRWHLAEVRIIGEARLSQLVR
jgi:ketosteroid isomerase-like protein